MVGQTISHYRILDKLGEGGMGVVYSARDTKLGRDVAIKLLADSFAHEPGRITRFKREAQLLAQLHHQNIASLYGVEESAGRYALVMELAEGVTLAERLADGPIPVDEALPIARQIAEALEAAHEKGIVHRDLKPANIKIDADGKVKVLDFGLAKALEDQPAPADPEDSPTLTAAATRAGIILGTAAYMSPEQARGRPADKRADIWAFAVVLYEMLTGRELFPGDTVTDSLAGVLRAEVDLDALPAETPSSVRRLLRRCLQRDRQQRLHDIGDARLELEEVTPAEDGLKTQPRRRGWVLALGAAMLAFSLGFAVSLFRSENVTPAPAPLRKLGIPLDHGVNEVVISPNGRHVAYVSGLLVLSDTTLWIRDLDRDESRKIAGPAQINALTWSSDSVLLGYVENLELKRVPVGGGAALSVCRLPGPAYGATWSPDGNSIVVSLGTPSRLYEVPVEGGEPKLLFEPDSSEERFIFVDPHFLPADGRGPALVFARGVEGDFELEVFDVASGERKELLSGANPFYSPTGHLLFTRPDAGGIMAMPFSPKTLSAAGDSFLIAENATNPTVAGDGTLAYVGWAGASLKQLIWRDRSGQKLGVIGQPQDQVGMPDLSPDGNRVVVIGEEKGVRDIWIHDSARRLKTRLTSHPSSEDRPIWTADGATITFTASVAGTGGGVRFTGGATGIFTKRADGSGQRAVLESSFGSSPFAYGIDWSADGQRLACVVVQLEGGVNGDIWYLERRTGANDYRAVPFVTTKFDEFSPTFSPDGRFLAYQSNESGRHEVYVRSFPVGDRRWQISSKGGGQPRWRGDGGELYYVEGDTLVAVGLTTSPTFSLGESKRLFEEPGAFAGRGHRYDVSADGTRFVMVEELSASKRGIRLVQNWFEEFRDRP